MKNSIWVSVVLLITIGSCGPCCNNTDVSCYTKYYMNDSCIITEYGTYIVEKSKYERKKNKCDEIEYFTIYQRDFVKDTFIYDYHYKHEEHGTYEKLIPYSVDTMHCLFYHDPTGVITDREILKTIDICDIDSIIFEDLWFYD